MNKQHNILPSSPVDVFFGLATQGGDSLLTQDASFLGFEGIAFIDSKEYVPTLVSKQSNRSLTSKVYSFVSTEKIIVPVEVSYLITNKNQDFLRTQDGNFIII